MTTINPSLGIGIADVFRFPRMCSLDALKGIVHLGNFTASFSISLLWPAQKPPSHFFFFSLNDTL